MGENLEMKSALDHIFLATTGREDELINWIVVALWFLAESVGRLGNSFTILSLLFLVTVVNLSCAVKFVDLDTNCVECGPSALFPDVN
jgi:hypothetical protein